MSGILMPKVTTEDVRGIFLDFFESRGHHRIAGSSLIPQNDPTLLFINSGMAPMKRFFIGHEKPPYPDLCNVQPCIRTKDIDDVGDRHHLTLFEMLGSWSIGRYFKQRAIELAYELLTEGFGFAVDRLYVTVFGGDSALGLPADEESVAFWEGVGVPRSRIVALGMADNFWGPAGETGPCGPCTEVFYDFGDTYGDAYRTGTPFDTTNRYIEIWNAGVFMQFDKRRDGTFGSLPFVSVDTGAGIERLTMALNEFESVYETDLLSSLVTTAQDLLGQSGKSLDHHRLMADHVRAATFIMSEGVRPSNEGRGYIPRRLIRKCVAIACQHSASSEFDLCGLATVAIDLMSPHYPRLAEQRSTILEMLAAEEREFSRVVQRGLERLEALFEASPEEISGRDAFQLHATYGLPFEITRDLAMARGTRVSEAKFRDEYEKHREMSRSTSLRETRRLAASEALADIPQPSDSQFVGYDTTSARAVVVAVFQDGVRVDVTGKGDNVEILLDQTPFYALAGGQVGDTGTLVGEGGARAAVTGTTKHRSGYHVHAVEVIAGSIAQGDVVWAEVDGERRSKAAANHSATHLIYAALRQVLGTHVRQAGSLVEPERLRFDFSNQGPVPWGALLEAERVVNRWILRGLPRVTEVLDTSRARQTGALFLDDEDYGDSVRVVRFADASVEFCGGTHVDTTAAIGLFRISGEQAVAAGVRRITAVTREEALELTLERDRLLLSSAGVLKVSPAELPARVEKLASRLKSSAATAKSAEVAELKVTDQAGTPVAGAVIDDDTVDVRAAAQREAERLSAVVALMRSNNGRAQVAVAVPPTFAERADAREVLRRLLAPIHGRGGGSARAAQGGGRAGVDELAALLKELPAAVNPG